MLRSRQLARCNAALVQEVGTFMTSPSPPPGLVAGSGRGEATKAAAAEELRAEVAAMRTTLATLAANTRMLAEQTCATHRLIRLTLLATAALCG
jgi:hypothetical protein